MHLAINRSAQLSLVYIKKITYNENCEYDLWKGDINMKLIKTLTSGLLAVALLATSVFAGAITPVYASIGDTFYTYDSNWNVIASRTVTSQEEDENGNITTQTFTEYDASGNVVGTSIYTYTYYSSGKLKTNAYIKYDTSGKVITGMSTTYDEDHNITEYTSTSTYYDSNGNKTYDRIITHDNLTHDNSTTNIYYDENGNTIGSEVDVYSGNIETITRYDANGNITYRIKSTFDRALIQPDKNLIALEEWKYYTNGNVKEYGKSTYSEGNNLKQGERWTYYENGNNIKQYEKRIYSEGNNIKQYEKYTYYENGNIETYLVSDEDKTEEFIYDEFGNLIRHSTYDKFGNLLGTLSSNYKKIADGKVKLVKVTVKKGTATINANVKDSAGNSYKITKVSKSVVKKLNKAKKVVIKASSKKEFKRLKKLLKKAGVKTTITFKKAK